MTKVPDLTLDAGLPADVDCERTVLGAILLDNQALPEVMEAIKPADLSLDSHRRIALRMAQLYSDGIAVDIRTLADKLKSMHEVECIGGVAYLASLTEGLPRRPVIEDYLRIIKDKSMLRRLMGVCSHAIAEAADQSINALGVIGTLQKNVDDILSGVTQAKDAKIEKFFIDSLEKANQRYLSKVAPRIPTGNAWIDSKIGGILHGYYTIVAARPKIGKALRLDELIKTPSGWKANKELKIGDKVASIDGKPSCVTGVFPQGERQMYAVSFTDGRTLECDGQHLWTVYCRHWPEPKLMTTLQVMEKLTHKRYQKRMWIDDHTGQFGCKKQLPIHPWALGAILGNGCITKTHGSCGFSSADRFTVRKLRSLVPQGCSVSRQDKYGYRVIGKELSGESRILTRLSRLGLSGHRAETKFIPESYLNSTKANRLSLLQGLLDTDGSVDNGVPIYCTSSPTLAKDVQELARSLGATAKITVKKEPIFTYKSERRVGLRSYRVYISHPDANSFVSLPRKKKRVRLDRRQNRLNFVSVVPTAKQAAQCITVSHPTGLYIASRQYVVTHNSAFGDTAIAFNCQHGRRVVKLSLEVDKDTSLYNLVPHVVDIPNIVCVRQELQTPEQNRLFNQGMAHILENWNLSIYEGDIDCDETCWIIDRETKDGQEVLFVLDHFGLMVEAGKSSAGKIRESYVTDSGRLRRKIYGKRAAILALFQLNEVPREYADKLPRPADIGESKKPLQDCAAMILLHRYQDKETLKMTKKANINLALVRNGGSSGNTDGVFDTRKLEFVTEPEIEYEDRYDVERD